MLAAFDAACCAAKGVPLREPRKPSEPELFQLKRVALPVGDGHDGVVERGLNVRNTVGHILALALLEFLVLAGLAGYRLLLWLLPLGLRRRFLLAGDCALTGSLAGAGIGVGALTAHRQLPPVAQCRDSSEYRSGA